MSESPRMVLASTSPRRRELLARLGVPFIQLDAGTDETRLGDEAPEQFVTRLAGEKATAGWRLHGSGIPSLGADTVVVIEGRIMGKPATRQEAAEMLESLSGRVHEVFSAVAVALDGQRVLRSLSRTSVKFAELPVAWIREYCATDEPMDKAGAYAIQGGAGRHILAIDGSYSGVMGLPLDETRELLCRAGVLP
jgi:septum formation protein